MKKLMIGLVMAVLGLVGVVAIPEMAYATKSQLCQDLAGDPELAAAAGCDLTDQDTADKMANNIIQVVLSLLGVLAVGVMILGGIMYIVSTGDAAKVHRAKNLILYGLIGLVVSLLAYTIATFVIQSVAK